MKRRKLLRMAAAGAAISALPKLALADSTPASIVIHPEHVGRHIPQDYIGLSYELAQLTEAAFFSPAHADLISLFRQLSPSGLLRLGGNTSEFCWLQVEPSTKPISLHVPSGDLALNWMPHRLFAIQPDAIYELEQFLHATGWRTIYGLNFGNSTPDRAAAEAAHVARALGDRLAFFQIGNEPDFYRDANNQTRPRGWNFDDYAREWIAFADAITAAVPNARFGGPDVGASSDWVTRFGDEISGRLGKRLVALSGHYYAEGPPNDPAVTTTRLLAGDPNVAKSTSSILRVADAHHLAYHMTEGNSCYRGGKPSMSDAFAAALWCGDYLLLLASLGCDGINLHGGDSRFLSAGLGDHNPGLEATDGRKAIVLNGFYTPIASELGQPVSARPVFYGMLIAQLFAGASMLGIESNVTGNLTAYAATKNGRQLLAIFNKDAAISFDVSISSETPLKKARFWQLIAPSLDSLFGVTFGGSSVTSLGEWTPKAQQLSTSRGTARLHLPAASGAIVFLD